MKTYSFIGVILLAIGVGLFIYGHQGIQEYQTLAGQVTRTLSAEAQQQYQMYSYARIGGGILAVLGLGEMVVNR